MTETELRLAATALWYAEKSYERLDPEDEAAWLKQMLEKVRYMSGAALDDSAVFEMYNKLFRDGR